MTAHKKIKQYRNYLFDADGTLLNTAELVFQSFQYACEKYGGLSIERSRVVGDMGQPLARQIQLYLGRQTEQDLATILADYRDYQLGIYQDHLSLFPGVEATLSALKRCEKKLAVVTSRKMETAALYLKSCHIFDFFEVIITPEATSRHKPHPAPALKALTLLGGIPGETLFVGDASFDMECGQQAGTDTAWVCWSQNDSSDIQPPPTYILQQMSDLVIDDTVDPK